MEKWKNKYYPKIKTVKYLELIDQDKFWIIFNTASKIWKFPGLESSHSIFTTFSQISDF